MSVYDICKLILVACLSLVPSLVYSDISEDDFNILTYKEPPFVMFDEGILYGVATDVINKALLKVDIEDYYIRIYPKKRTEFYAARDKNYMFFPALKTEYTQSQFILVGPIIKTKVFAYSIIEREKHETKEEFFAQNYNIAVASGSRQFEMLLKGTTEKNIQDLPSEENNIEKLKNDRVDIWVTTELNAAYLKQRKEVKALYPLYEFEGHNELYLAIQKDSDPLLIERFQKIFSSLNQDGEIEQIQKDFLKNLEIWSQSSF